MTIFTRDDVQPFLRDRLMPALRQYFPRAAKEEPSPEYVMEAMEAAETDLEREVRSHFAVRKVLPMSATPEQWQAARACGGAPPLEDPGYPFDPMLFEGDTWSLTLMRYTPIVSIEQMSFNYPDPYTILYTVPADWIRIDKKMGQVNLVPTSNFINFPFTALLLQVATGGREIPYFLQVTYTVGMPNIRKERKDIVDLILKMAVLRIIDDRYIPSSGSTSADGLSRSVSFSRKDYVEMLGRYTETLRQSLRGIRLMVA